MKAISVREIFLIALAIASIMFCWYLNEDWKNLAEEVIECKRGYVETMDMCIELVEGYSDSSWKY